MLTPLVFRSYHRVLLALLLLLPRVAPAAEAVPRVGLGDVREGYERADFRSRSAALDLMPGQRLDLAALAARPPAGLGPSPYLLRPAAVDLGRQLFFDRRLSANATLSCAMCHVPEQGFTQNEVTTPVGIEGRTVRRNAPSLYNVGLLPVLFHDGRTRTLEAQIWEPLLAANEMGNPGREQLLERLRAIAPYPALFAALYPQGLTAETLGDALASYQRGLLAGESRHDRWRAGEEAALDAQELRGQAVFREAGCGACHVPGTKAVRFTDDDFHNTGIAWRSVRQPQTPARVQLAPGVEVQPGIAFARAVPADEGRFEVSGREADRRAFRTPGLRNVAVTAPYMHDGSLATLEEVVEYYDVGGSADPQQDARMRPLGIGAADKQALAAFLRALSASNLDALAADARSVRIGERE